MRTRRLGAGLADQIFSSASNILVVMAVARVSSVAEFGATTLAFTGVTATMGTLRGLLGTQLSLLTREPEALHAEARHAFTFALVTGSTAGVFFTALGLFVGAPTSVLCIAAVAPLVLAQDVGRFLALASLRPNVALASDATWCAGSLLAWCFTFTRTGAKVDATYYVLCWALFSGIALAVVAFRMGFRPALRGHGAWLRGWNKHRLRFGAEAALGTSGPLLVLIIATASAGAAASAALRGASTLIGPLSVVMSAAPITLVPELRQEVAPSARQLWRKVRPLAVGLSAMAVTMAALAFLVPSSWGWAALGPTWGVVRPIFPVTAAEYVGLAWLTAARTSLRAQNRSHDLMVLAIGFTLGGTIGSLIAGSIFHRALAVAITLAATAWVGAICARAVLLSGRSANSLIRRDDYAAPRPR